VDPRDLCLHELIVKQARRTPEEPAVVDERTSLSYEELDLRAERLAAYLRDAGVREDTVVGVYMERRVEYVVACLAAMKAGGAFLPLEMAYPPSLVAQVIEDAEPPAVLTMRRHEDGLPREQVRLCLDEGWEEAVEGRGREEQRPRQDNLAFVSYSSGTTGKPKGIANPHRAAVRSYFWRFGISDYGPGDRVACNVFFIWEVFRPLLRGATSYVIPDDVIFDPAALISFLEEHRITETLMTPSLLGSVLDAGGADLSERLRDLRTLWLNGEVVTNTLVRRAIALLPETRLLNVYSASETHEMAAGDLRKLLDSSSATYCPVGPPMDRERTYVLDADGRPTPEGEPGELYVGGDGLARGYVNLPEKTAERFLEDPFSEREGARLYRTGDRARLLPDGNLEVMGRVDFMVKVRGYSIELGAVEAAIEKALAVRDCVVVAEGEEGEDKRLVAYLVPDPDDREGRYADWRVDPETGRSPEVRRRLEESLPHYMIPAVFVELATLPLQETTGKVDRRNLPPPPPRVAATECGSAQQKVPADAPREEKEDFLARTWEAVLGLRKGGVGREDGFFDLGGHSLAAAELSGRVEDAFGVHVSMREFLAEPTVAGLCDRIEAKSEIGLGDRPAREAPDPGAALLAELRADAVLEPGIGPRGTGPGNIAPRDARCVFLTGATGFLGAFLLDSLLSRTDAEVRCLVRAGGDGPGGADHLAPVRENLEGYGLWRPEHARRIVPVVGNLAKPLLGLTQGDFDGLADGVDLIFHAGARVNLVYPYSHLEAANVGGTREVVRLACRRGATPVHHVSSNGIFPPEGSNGRPWKEDVDLDALAGARGDGYGQSKWVAEKLVWQAGERGLPVRVYRPGNISGHSVTGASNPRDTLGAILVESLRLGAAPRVEGWRMEMTPVDFVSEAICHIAGDPSSSGKAFHLANLDPPPAEEVFAWLEGIGYALNYLDYPEWAEALRKAWRREGDGSASAGLRGAAPAVEDLRDGNSYDDANVREALLKGGLRRPEIDALLMGNYARYFAQRGWVGPPDADDARRTVARARARDR
jgi:amino acid adenylation domain-containing protein/thioester reductase-like protein